MRETRGVRESRRAPVARRILFPLIAILVALGLAAHAHALSVRIGDRRYVFGRWDRRFDNYAVPGYTGPGTPDLMAPWGFLPDGMDHVRIARVVNMTLYCWGDNVYAIGWYNPSEWHRQTAPLLRR